MKILKTYRSKLIKGQLFFQKDVFKFRNVTWYADLRFPEFSEADKDIQMLDAIINRLVRLRRKIANENL